MRYYALLLAVSFVTRLPSLFVRVVDADEAVYSNAARGILRGLVLYRDVIDQKPPLIYYLYALFLGIVNDLRFVHAMTIVVVWLTAIVVYRLVARCFDRRSGMVAGILYAAFVSTVGYASNTEVFMNLPLVMAVWFFHLGGVTKPEGRVTPARCGFYGCLLLAGICVGIASLIKQQAVVVLAPLCLMMIVTRFRGRIGRGLCELLALFIGAVVPFVLVLLYFRHLGVVHDFIHWAYIYNMRYIAPESGVFPVIVKAALVAVLPTLILWWYSLKRIDDLHGKEQGADRGAIVFGLLWLAASIFAVSLGQRFYTHYFVQLIPPLVFLAAQPIAMRLYDLRRMRPLKRIVFFCFLIVPAIAVTVTVGIKAAGGGFDCQKPSVIRTAEFIDENTKPDDRIFVWGDAVIEYLADRPNASRFMNNAFVLENRDPCYSVEGIDASKFATTKEFGMLMSDLTRQPPRIIVDTSSSTIHCWQNYPIDKFAPLSSFIRQRYKNVTDFDGIRVWFLRNR